MFSSLPMRLVLVLLLFAGCAGRSEDSDVRLETGHPESRAVVRRAVPVSITIDSVLIAEPTGDPASGPAYEAALAATLLPYQAPTGPLRVAVDDTIDVSNYQAEGWWMILGDRSPRARSRFSAGFERFTSGLVIFSLDTLLARDQEQSPFESAPADSAGARGLGELERLATKCRLAGHRLDERILGVVPDTTPERWMRPRVAWFIDTVASRFRPIRPDSLSCRLAPAPD